MDALLNEYLLNEVSNVNHDFVRNLVHKGKKQDICTYICHFVCDHVLSNNVWVYAKFKEYLQHIEVCKPSERDRLVKLVYAMCHLVGNADKGTFTFHFPNEKTPLFTEDIKNIRYSNGTKDFPDLVQLQPILTEEAYTLLSIMYEAFLYSVESKANLQKCFVILRYFLTLSPRHYIQGTTRGVTMDIIDFVFLICVWYGNNPHCTQDLQQYISLVKDIFYYKLKKKDKVLRINILFYLIYVLIEKRTRNQMIDYDGASWSFATTAGSHDDAGVPFVHEDTRRKKSRVGKGLMVEDEDQGESSRQKLVSNTSDANAVDEKCQYLFIYMDYDERLRYELELERERNKMMSKLMRTSTKDVEIDSLLMRDPKNDVHITKLSR